MRLGPTVRPLQILFIAGLTLVNPAGAFASGSGRLGRDVEPAFESLKLTLDAGKPGYTGLAHVDLRVRVATDSFQFHSEGITLKRVILRGAKGIVPSTHAQSGPTVVTVRTRSPLRPGTYALDIDFGGIFSTQAQGLYRIETGGDSYCFSQFESDDARKAFPCWDEPSFKIPYQVTLVVPKRHEAVSNTPIARVIPGKLTKTVIFRRTRPLASYVIAFATGPLEFVPIQGMSVPGRIVTVKGASGLAQKAATMAPPILRALERYFGGRYPYEKLDLIAVPEFWPGAMENVGAITFRDDVLLFDPRSGSTSQLATLSVFMAHEMAHMWFGDLVTMEWWDDLWLNESFAEWMGNKISDEVFPEYNAGIRDLRQTQVAMAIDARLSTRAIRHPVSALDNLLEAADELAYQKGQSVLRMFEGWIGPEIFRRGVLDYIAAHRDGTAVGADLWNALSKTSGKDMSAAMATFLDQGGLPLVSVEATADGYAKVSQHRFMNYGTNAPTDQLWKVPVGLTFSDGERTRSQYVLLSGRDTTLALEGGRSAVWIHPNAGESGYYRWSVSPQAMLKLAEGGAEAMTPRERVGFMGNLSALEQAGLLHGDDYLRLLSLFTNDPKPEVISAVIDGVEGIRSVFITQETASPFAIYVRQTLWPSLNRFGITKRAGEDESVSLMRPSLIRTLGDEGMDTRIRAFADSLAKIYARDPSSVDPSLAAPALNLSAIGGDQALYETYKMRFETAQVPAERSRYLVALGYFRDPKVVDQSLRYSLEGPLRPQEIFTIPSTLGRAYEYEEVPFRWLTQNYDGIASRIPPMFTAFMPQFASGCSVKRLEAAKVFFAEAAHSAPGTEKELAKVADRVNDCAGLREREGAAVVRYLNGLAGVR